MEAVLTDLFQNETAAKRGPQQHATTGLGPNNRSGPHWGSLSRGPLKKELLPKRVNNIQLLERAPTEAVKIGPSKKKLLLKRAHGNIQQPKRALLRLSRRVLPKRNCC